MRSMATQTDVNNHRNNQRHSAHYPMGSTDYADEKVNEWSLKMIDAISKLEIFSYIR